MPVWGKLLGTAAGLVSGRPWFALLGLVLGHQFDRGFAARYRPETDSADGRVELSESFLRALFQTMGHLAKTDGRVTEAEIRAARRLMDRLSLDRSQTRRAIDWFEDGKARSFPMLATVRRLARDTAKQPEQRSAFIRLLTEVSLSKGRIQSGERALLWAACKELEVGRVELAQLDAMLRAQRAFRQSPAGRQDEAALRDAYSVLGVDRTASNDDIKKAYRRLMNRYHPDKLAASDPGAEALAEAERKTRDVRSAYETLKTRRLIR